MRFDPNTCDIHPTRCDCGLCDPVYSLTWTEIARHVLDGLLFVAVMALVLGLLFVQVVIV
jgi:hypothetical protein